MALHVKVDAIGARSRFLHMQLKSGVDLKHLFDEENIEFFFDKTNNLQIGETKHLSPFAAH